MSERFFSHELITGNEARLDGPEAHHLLHVMRAGKGAVVTLFDGSGAEFDAEIVACGRANVQLRIQARREVDRALPFELTVGVSLPKGDRQKWLIEKLTELGVTTMVPLVTDRGVAQPTDRALERLERSVIEAAKQCGRNRLMRITKPQAWQKFADRNNSTSATRRLMAHPRGSSIANGGLTSPQSTILAIGPEGGFTDEEVTAARAADWQIVDMGPRILRVETAAIALAAIVAGSVRP